MIGYHSGYADVYCLLGCAVVQFDRHFYSEEELCVPSKPQFHTRRHPIQQTELSNLKYFEVHTSENNRTLAKLLQPIVRTASIITSFIKIDDKNNHVCLKKCYP
jgi:hypothetical protein